MDTATASRLKAADDNAAAHQRAIDRAFKRSGRIYRKPKVDQPSALDQIKANGPMAKMGKAFNESRAGAQRSANVANAKANGTFDVIRERYNRENLGKASMSEDGEIAGPNSPAPAVASKSAADTPAAKSQPRLKPLASRPLAQRGDVVKPAKEDMFPSRKGLSTRIQERFPDGYDKPEKGSVGNIVKGLDGAIAKNKDATETMNRVFKRNKA